MWFKIATQCAVGTYHTPFQAFGNGSELVSVSNYRVHGSTIFVLSQLLSNHEYSNNFHYLTIVINTHYYHLLPVIVLNTKIVLKHYYLLEYQWISYYQWFYWIPINKLFQTPFSISTHAWWIALCLVLALPCVPVTSSKHDAMTRDATLWDPASHVRGSDAEGKAAWSEWQPVGKDDVWDVVLYWLLVNLVDFYSLLVERLIYKWSVLNLSTVNLKMFS